MELFGKEEKKVEYLELIYDLIFVYLIGRNNSLLHHVQDGFISGSMFLTYVICTLTIIQIWNFSTFYINRYGRNGLRDHVFLFVNMYLLYFMADGIRVHWQEYFDRYNTAWMLILVNISIQYFIERRNHKAAPWEIKQIEVTGTIILIEALIVAVSIPIFHVFGVTIAFVAVLFGIGATIFSGKVNDLVSVDFAHLSERAMLYVVFTFGEMIIAIAGYFEGEPSFNTIYFSSMAFLIVAGLFLCYGTLYDHIIDREMSTRGTGYMMIHVFLIFALNNISTALELMREEEVELLPKTLFLIGSFLIYYVFLFMTERYAKERLHFTKKLWLSLAAFAVGFVGLMLLFREMMYVNIAITVIYVFWVFSMLYRYGKHVREE
ncbi:MAG: low temperature requirement protein A [Lachnospiraceae bacterium]|nr:low temperature requirement protein A [Lachnospiraceae bacterium]